MKTCKTNAARQISLILMHRSEAVKQTNKKHLLLLNNKNVKQSNVSFIEQGNMYTACTRNTSY